MNGQCGKSAAIICAITCVIVSSASIRANIRVLGLLCTAETSLQEARIDRDPGRNGTVEVAECGRSCTEKDGLRDAKARRISIFDSVQVQIKVGPQAALI